MDFDDVFCFRLGFVLYAISVKLEVFDKVWGAIGIIFMLSSGVFYSVSILPQQIQEIILWIPMIHGTEMFRHGYFGTTITTMENPWYLALWDIVLLFIGLMSVNNIVRQGAAK